MTDVYLVSMLVAQDRSDRMLECLCRVAQDLADVDWVVLLLDLNVSTLA